MYRESRNGESLLFTRKRGKGSYHATILDEPSSVLKTRRGAEIIAIEHSTLLKENVESVSNQERQIMYNLVIINK